jgi:flagellar M-ring protein FliF
MATNAATLSNPPLARMGAGLRPLLVLLGIAAAVAAGVTVAIWSQGPNWGMLYASLTADDAANVVQALQSTGIQYKIDSATGAVMVPQDRISDARLKLAAQGLPAGDGGGFELIRKDPGFGVSQFMETARYQHALEVELVRTITSLQAVEAARVHLATPAQSAFVRDRKPGSASVFIKLHAGRVLESEQVSGIVHLVASSIPGLEAEGVTVVDQQGRLLSAPKSAEAQAADAQVEAARRIENKYVSRIEQLLAPIVGAGRVRAQVTADIDSSAMEETREQYRPESQVIRSEQLAEQTASSGAGAGGVPGALSNQPPPAGVVLPPGAPATAAATAAAANPAAGAAPATVAATPENASKQSTRNFEIDRTLSYVKQPAGSIRRLTVAVLVDNIKVTDKDGKVEATAVPAKQLEDITRLVKDAVGYDEKRGDSVNVVNASFVDDAALELEAIETPIWQNPLVLTMARLLLGTVVAIVLLLVVVRPLMKSIMTPARAGGSPNLPGGAVAGANEQLAAPAPTNAPALGAPKAATSASMQYEDQVAAARALVSQDPKRVAQVVKNWVGTDE